MSESVLVIGSIVVDLPMILPRHPLTGETLKVSSPGMNLGGKAVNQGLQSQLCGANVQLVGKIGRDSFGEWVLAELTHYGLRTDSISRSNSAATSCAVPIIEPGNQYILHVPGANADLTEQDVVQSVVRNTSRILLLQGEIPPSSSLAAARLIHQRGGIVICDPAPTTGMSPELLSEADILTPNSQELMMLTGVDNDVMASIDLVWKRYPNLQAIIVTQGEHGVLLQERDVVARSIPAPQVYAVDPTAAGDAFNGAFATALLNGHSLESACEIGCCAGALAATKIGAAQSLASGSEIMSLWKTVYYHSAG